MIRTTFILLKVVGLAWALVAVIALTGAAPVHAPRDVAAASQVTLDVRGGFDGYYKVGGWLPIFAIASNEGPPFDGTLKLAGTATGQTGDNYGAVANLPTHSRKLLEFATPVTQTDRTRTVTLTNGGDVVLTRSLPLNPLGSRDYLYGVVSPSAGALRVLQGRRQYGGTISVAHLGLADIPAYVPALADLDALVVNDTATSALSVPQRQAISAWVASGGQLIVCGGAGAGRTISGLADIVPLDLTGTEAVDLGSSLTAWGGAADAGRAATAIGQPKSGSIVRLRAGANPLVVDRPMGRGWVTVVALGADEPSMRDGEGAAAFWNRVLSGARLPLGEDADATGAGVFSTGIDASSRDRALYAMPETALPSSANLALFVFCYIVAVGPLSAFVLAWFDRREWLWVTIPVISLLFAAGAYLVALDVKGTSLVINTVSIAHGTEGQQGSETRSYVGIFSPRRDSYNLRLSGAKGVTPLDTTNEQHRPMTLSDGDAVVLRDMRIEQWAVRAFDARHNNVTRPPIESSLTLSGSSLDGWVRNTGPQPLDDTLLAVGGDQSSIGLLSPGQQANVHLTLTGTARPSSPRGGVRSASATPTTEQSRRAALLTEAGERAGVSSTLGPAEVWSTSGARIVAFDADPPFPIKIEGHVAREHDLTLQVVDVPIAFGSAMHVPTGFARRDLLENAGLAANYYGSGLPLGTSTTIQLALPPEVAGATWTALHLHIDIANANSASGRSGRSLSIALYNWNSGQWDAEPNFTGGVNTVNPPAPYVDERGLVRVRFTGSNGQDELRGLDIDAVGVRAVTAIASAITVQDLSHRYGAVVAVDHLSLEIPEGAVYGLIGPNGAGKTTTIRSICTLLVPTSGDVLVQGLSIRRDARTIRPALGYMPDNFGLYDELRVWEYLDFFARCYAIAPAVRATTIPEVLELVDLSGKRDAYVAGLSRGMRQRLAIARTLLHDPSILILDEPAAGLDPRARIELRELLRELRRLGKTILLSSHILSDLAEICTHVAIVDRGRLVIDGPLPEVLARVQGGRTLRIEVLGPWDAARHLLESLPLVRDVRSEEQEGGRTRLVCQISGDDGDQIAVLATLVSAGIPVATFREETANLEDVFMRLTAPFST